ncbi:MAG: hypothetical protein JEY96_03775 [Bacteroidales bacterium]|nr:hypothetical protein [Bacteroidales bacterium]
MVRILNIYIFTLVVFAISINTLSAQTVSVEAKLDTTEFLIGDQVGLELHVKQPVNVDVAIPIFDSELTNQIEIVEQSENDTSLLENGDWLIKKRILITAFDSGYYALPPIPVLYYSDTIKTEPLLFKVNTIKVDTSQAIKDIKMPYAAPLTFKEVLPWAGGTIGVALLILVLVYVFRKIKRNEPIIRRLKPKEPAHIIALRDLTKLNNDKLWQKERIKLYYTELSDILRVYLWNRYSIRTMERTSEEILESLKISDFKNDELFDELQSIFKISDLVKFAKFKPLPDENATCMNNAYDFVEKTKLIVVEKEEEIQIENEQQKVESGNKELIEKIDSK